MNIETTTTERAADMIEALAEQTEDPELQAGAQKAAELAETLASHREQIAAQSSLAEALLNARQIIAARSTEAANEIRVLGLAESSQVLKWAQDGGDGSPPINQDLARLHLELDAVNRAVEFGVTAQWGAAKRSAELAIRYELLAAKFETATAIVFDMVTSRSLGPVLAFQGNVTFQGEATVQFRESAAAHARRFEILRDQFQRDWLDA